MHKRNARYGLWLFAIYLVFYGGFVLLAAFAPRAMERTPMAGVNLAIWYGFGLIALALVLALFYGWLCRIESTEVDAPSEPGRPAPGARRTPSPESPPAAPGGDR